MDTKKTKKSKHGKKNWRKNIDVTDIESKVKAKNKEEIIEGHMQKMKDEELFTMDYTKGKDKFSGKKRQRTPKRVSLVDKKKIKRIISANENKAEDNKEEESNKMVDLWADEDINEYKYNKSNKKKKTLSISYPAVPLPHPGQSYNPSKDDLSKLLYKVVELNKPMERSIKEKEREEEEKRKARAIKEQQDNEENGSSDNDNSDNNEEEEEEEEEDDIPCTHPVSNNPPTLDNRLSKKERRKIEQRKAHLLRVKEAKTKKQVKIEFSNFKSTRRIEKEKKRLQEEEAKAIKDKEAQLKKKQVQYSLGIIDDKDLLEDFIVKKEQTPLRKMKANHNYLSERFDNLVKRNVIGKDNQKPKKNNRKLNKYAYMDTTGSTYRREYNDDKLQMFN